MSLTQKQCVAETEEKSVFETEQMSAVETRSRGSGRPQNLHSDLHGPRLKARRKNRHNHTVWRFLRRRDVLLHSLTNRSWSGEPCESDGLVFPLSCRF